MTIGYGKQSIRSDDIRAVIKSLQRDHITQGNQVSKFEIDLKKRFRSKFCTAVSSGTAALHLAGKALGWKKNDIIITSPITFLASANAIEYSGATTDLVDIDKESYCIDPEKLESKLKKYKSRRKKIKAVVAVDYAGHPCDWKSLKFLANKYNFKLINDNCHALGASYFKDPFYAAKYADVVTQSFHPVKAITTGEGGAVITNNKLIDNKIKLLRSHGIKKNLYSNSPWVSDMKQLGYNYRITDFQCALGSNQLKKLKTFIKKRNDIAKFYRDELSEIEKIILPKESINIKHSYHLYPIQISFKEIGISRKVFFKKMINYGINLQVHYVPIYNHSYYKKKYNFKKSEFLNAESYYKQTCSLPIYPDLEKKDLNKIIKCLKKILNEKK